MKHGRIIQGVAIEEVLRDEIKRALDIEAVKTNEMTEFYLVNLLSDFHKAERSFDCGTGGVFEKPLALLFLEALEADSTTRINKLRRLGDTVLVVAGLFTDHVHRTLVKLPYYISIGGSAYGHLSNLMDGERMFSELYSELAVKFANFVNVFSIVAPWNRNAPSNTDIVRAYERWLTSGDDKLRSLLEEQGVVPRMRDEINGADARRPEEARPSQTRRENSVRWTEANRRVSQLKKTSQGAADEGNAADAPFISSCPLRS